MRLLGILVLACAALAPTAWAAQRADFRQEAPSGAARHVAEWVLDAADHGGRPFVIVDKLRSRVFVFDAAGVMQGAAPALIGSALGDESVPGIGLRKLSSILPKERTTPAGRFVASLDRSLQGDEILWVDYDSAIALHRVIASVPAERRLQRLESRVAGDRLITYGCINVPVKFFEQVVAPLFRGVGGIVYVLPDTRSVREVFGSYEVP
ncbi:MAG: hypothetical protein JWP22_288 [Ramlibacter sp.]|jgi:hypothetical protein|nr:hypothetical protein [Ramlibacter sp.]MDB5911613.1 hypothetical protein [Ramlibacter sp.]